MKHHLEKILKGIKLLFSNPIAFFNEVRNIIRTFNFKQVDSEFDKKLKSKFYHYRRGFQYNGAAYMVDALDYAALPGTLEMVILKIKERFKDSNRQVKLLNLGGGVNQMSKILEESGFDVTNTDISVTEDDKSSKSTYFDLNSNLALPFDDHSFDVVLCEEVIEHIENPWKLFRIAKPVLKDEGLFLVTTPNVQSKDSKKLFSKTGYFNWFDPGIEYHINPLLLWEMRMIAERTGWNISEITGNGEYFFGKGRKKTEEEIIKKNDNLIFIVKKK